MERRSSKKSVLQYLRGLYSRQCSRYNANGNEEEFYSQEFLQLLLFFNISYCTLVTPFRIAKANDGLYKIQTCVLQQICVAILNIVAVTILIREEFHEFEGNVIQKPEQLFKNVKAFTRVLAFLIGIYIFWTKKSKLKKLLKISQNGGNEEQMSRILITCATIIFLGMWITDYGIYTCFEWTKEVEEHARDINKLLNYGTTTSPLTFQSKLMGSFYYCLKLYAYYIEELCELAILTIAFTVYRTCSGFHNLLESKTQDLTKISLHYHYVRKITDLINKFVGPFLSVYILGLMCYLLISVIKLFKMEKNPNPYALYFYYGYLAKNAAIFVIAAEANRKMHSLKEWLFQFKMEELHNRRIRTRTPVHEIDRKLKEEVYKILSIEVSTTQIGLGSYLFTITYGFITMLLSIFVTYTIIQLEFYKDDIKATVVENKEAM